MSTLTRAAVLHHKITRLEREGRTVPTNLINERHQFVTKLSRLRAANPDAARSAEFYFHDHLLKLSQQDETHKAAQFVAETKRLAIDSPGVRPMGKAAFGIDDLQDMANGKLKVAQEGRNGQRIVRDATDHEQTRAAVTLAVQRAELGAADDDASSQSEAAEMAAEIADRIDGYRPPPDTEPDSDIAREVLRRLG